ncbi:hypothetical protein Hanom_Chr13g01237881 [Helianthus anomalus]
MEREVTKETVKENGNAHIIEEADFSELTSNINNGGNFQNNLEDQGAPVKILKRKKNKSKVFEVGQNSGGNYTSSNDRPNKEPKNSGLSPDDPFNLNPIILGMDYNVVKKRGTNTVELANSFQVLLEDQDQPYSLADQEDTEVNEDLGYVTPIERASIVKEKEVTMEFGKR